MTERTINDSQFEALLLGFLVPEMDAYHGASWKDYKDVKAVRENPELFEDGLKLKKDVLFIYSADTQREYNDDRARYDDTVAELNTKYGRVAYTTSEIDDSDIYLKPFGGYGLVGLRYTGINSVQITEFIDGKAVTTMTYPKNELDAEDAKIRDKMGFELKDKE